MAPVSRIAIYGLLSLAVTVSLLAFLARAVGARSPTAHGAGNCSSYQCFYYARGFLRSKPDPKPGQVARVPLAHRIVGPAAGTGGMLVGLDNGPWSFWKVSDGFAQGRSGLVDGISAGNVYNFGHWQYVDELYYYLHDTVSVPPTQWVNAGHRNGVPVLGTVTGDCTDAKGKPLCAPQAANLFSPAKYRDTVKKLYDYAAAYGFDGWMIDMEAGFEPSPSVLRAVKSLSRMRLPDGRLLRVAVYEGGEQSLKPTGMLPYFAAGAAWQSDYASFAPPPVYTATTYQTLVKHHLASQKLRAYWSSYVYDFQRGCPEGDRTTSSQIWNGNGGSSAKCLDTAALFRNQRTSLPQSFAPGTPAFYTSNGLFAPVWPYFGNLPNGVGPVSRAGVQAADDALWVGADVRYSGPSCRRSGTNNAVSGLISPRSVVGSLPFVTNFNEGEGDVYAVQGKLVATAPWNNLSAQDVLPTWYCTQSGDLAATPTYATAADRDAFNGGSALALTGHSGEVELYKSRIRVGSSARPTLAFASKTVTGASPYVRVAFGDGTSDTVRASASGPGWQRTVSPLRARGKTITAISVGVAGRGAPADTVLGQLRLYDARKDTRPAPIHITSADSVISWRPNRKIAASYWNVYASAGGCVHFLGPAFTNRYDVTQPMFAPRQRSRRFVIQPVSASGSEALVPPVCGSGGRPRSAGRPHERPLPWRSRPATPGGITPRVVSLAINGLSPFASAVTRRPGTTTIRVGVEPLGVGVDARTHTIYVANTGDNTMSVIDATTHKVTATIAVGSQPVGVAVDPRTHTVYVANNGDNTVSVIDATTHKVTATIAVGNEPVGVAVDPRTHAVYVANSGDNTVSVIDATTHKVTATIAVGNEPYGIGVDATTHSVYVANADSNTVSVIDAASHSVTATVTVRARPVGVGVDPTTDTIYVADYNSDRVSVIDGASQAVKASVPVGKQPAGVGVDPTTDTIYVADYNGNTVSVINGHTQAVTATVPVGVAPYGLGIDPITQAASVSNFGDNTLSVITPHRSSTSGGPRR